jgi:hypothetical protein
MIKADFGQSPVGAGGGPKAIVVVSILMNPDTVGIRASIASHTAGTRTSSSAPHVLASKCGTVPNLRAGRWRLSRTASTSIPQRARGSACRQRLVSAAARLSWCGWYGRESLEGLALHRAR